MNTSNWIKNLPLISGEMKYKAQKVDRMLGEIEALRGKINTIEHEIRIELREADDLARNNWTPGEIAVAKSTNK